MMAEPAHVLSLDMELGHDDDRTLAEVIPDEQGDRPEARSVAGDLSRHLETLLTELPTASRPSSVSASGSTTTRWRRSKRSASATA
jgi:DNA-directed RNA polymerase sigma subunit (sigma70/sigma32)